MDTALPPSIDSRPSYKKLAVLLLLVIGFGIGVLVGIAWSSRGSQPVKRYPYCVSYSADATNGFMNGYMTFDAQRLNRQALLEVATLIQNNNPQIVSNSITILNVWRLDAD